MGCSHGVSSWNVNKAHDPYMLKSMTINHQKSNQSINQCQLIRLANWYQLASANRWPIDNHRKTFFMVSIVIDYLLLIKLVGKTDNQSIIYHKKIRHRLGIDFQYQSINWYRLVSSVIDCYRFSISSIWHRRVMVQYPWANGVFSAQAATHYYLRISTMEMAQRFPCYITTNYIVECSPIFTAFTAWSAVFHEGNRFLSPCLGTEFTDFGSSEFRFF